MNNFTKVIGIRKAGLRFQSCKSDESHIMRRLQDLKDQSTVDKNDPLVRLSHLNETDVENDWITGQNTVNADKALEIIDAQKNISKADRIPSVPSHSENGSGMELEAQKEAFQFIKKIPGVTFRDKLEAAQKRAIKYKLRQERTKEAKNKIEQSLFGELYAERFTPVGSFEKLESLADRRIEESIKQGGFKDVENIRGKPTELPKPNPHLSTTEQYLNNILVKQNLAPPWIANQSKISQDVVEFRDDLLRGFEKEFGFYLIKFRMVNASSDVNSVHRSIANSYGSVKGFLKFRFDNWKNSQKASAENRISTINSALRSYNLQAPLSTQKLYLLPEREFQRVWDNVDLDQIIDDQIQNSKNKQKAEKQNVRATSPSFSAFFKLW